MNVEKDLAVSTTQVRGLTQRFGRTQVLHGLDLTLGTGILGLLGPNGAGKTTFLRTLATIVKPSDGSMKLLGYDPADREQRRLLRRRLGYLPQALIYYRNFTLSEFVEYFALLKEMHPKEVKSAVDWALKRVGLEDRAKSKMRTLSGGMLRRAGLAQAIVNEPDFLLLDEPTAGLDPQQRLDFRTLLRDLGVDSTVIVSTHLVEDVGAACTDVALLDRGRLLFRGKPDELIGLGEASNGVGDSPLERGYSAVISRAHRGE